MPSGVETILTLGESLTSLKVEEGTSIACIDNQDKSSNENQILRQVRRT